jgi:phosphotransferase system  glucose/maltose/N-acetylglucosamine-specific IIC component
MNFKLKKISREQAFVIVLSLCILSSLLFRILDKLANFETEDFLFSFGADYYYIILTFLISLFVVGLSFERVKLRRKIVILIVLGLLLIVPFYSSFYSLSGGQSIDCFTHECG